MNSSLEDKLIKSIAEAGFISPLSPHACIQHLEKIAKEKHFYFPFENFTLRVNVNSIQVTQNRFYLFILCDRLKRRRERTLPFFICFRVIGHLVSSNNGTTIRFWVQIIKPFSVGGWVYFSFWFLASIFMFSGIILGVSSESLLESIFIELLHIIVVFGCVSMFYKTYKIGKLAILNMLYKIFHQDSPENSQGQDSKMPDSISSLKESP